VDAGHDGGGVWGGCVPFPPGVESGDGVVSLPVNFWTFAFKMVAVWLSGNVFGRINEVALRRAGLVLRWVTARWYTVLVSNQATQDHSAWPSLRG